MVRCAPPDAACANCFAVKFSLLSSRFPLLASRSSNMPLASRPVWGRLRESDSCTFIGMVHEIRHQQIEIFIEGRLGRCIEGYLPAFLKKNRFPNSTEEIQAAGEGILAVHQQFGTREFIHLAGTEFRIIKPDHRFFGKKT